MEKVKVTLYLLALFVFLSKYNSLGSSALLAIGTIVARISAKGRAVAMGSSTSRGALNRRYLVSYSSAPVICYSFTARGIAEVSFRRLRIGSGIVIHVEDSRVRDFQDNNKRGAVGIRRLRLCARETTK